MSKEWKVIQNPWSYKFPKKNLFRKFGPLFSLQMTSIHLVQENMTIEEEVIFKFGDQANTVNSENWKTIPLEAMDSRTDWVVILTDDAEAYLLEINAIVTKMKRPDRPVL